MAVVISGHAAAFGDLGHQLVCDIAWRYLDDDAQKEVIKLLRETRYHTFAESCTWPDHIKSDHAYDFAKPHHYINVDRDATVVTETDRCTKDGCVVDAIRYYQSILSGEKPVNTHYLDDKSKALMFLGHFVGDVHQPLHVSYADDLGGNKVSLEYQGQYTNPHKVWDTLLVVDDQYPSWKEYGSALYEDIQDTDMSQWDI